MNQENQHSNEDIQPLLDSEKVDRAKQVSRKPTSVDPECGVPQIRYAQYIEFNSLEEFMKFKDLPTIKEEDLATVDLAELERLLMAEDT